VLTTDAPLWPVEGPVPMSPSKVEQAVTCSLRWALEQAGGTKSQSMDQSLGTLLHEVLALLPNGTEAELAAAVDQRWPELGLPDGWVNRRARRRSEQMVRKLASYLARADSSVAQEAEFQVAIGRIRVHGFVDRLEDAGVDADGRPLLRVVDLKTGGEAVSQAAANENPQLGVYQAALDAGSFDNVVPGARAGGAALLYVGTPTLSPTQRTQVAPSDAENPRWVHDLLDELADLVTNAAMCATRNVECRHCPVVRSCPAQTEGRVVGS
jgi:RecB family exonuclease